MPGPLAIAGIKAGISIGSSLLGRSKRKKAARNRAAANRIQRQQAGITNGLARRRAVTQQRAALANAKAQTAALGVTDSASSATAGALDSQLAVQIARQKQKEAADTRTSQLDQSALRNDARASFVESLGSTAASLAGNIPTG